MNTLINCRNGPIAALLATGMLLSTTLAAQEPIDRRDLPTPANDGASCRTVNWNTDMIARYPWVVDSCHEVVMVDGKKWARFEARFQGMNRDGSFDADFVNRSDRKMSTLALMPGPNQTVMIDRREIPFSTLREDQRLNFYVPEGMVGFAIAPGAPASEVVRVVEPAKPAQPAIAPVRVAQVERRPATVLPATAGPLPLLALGGMMSLLGGLGMSLRRRNARSDV